MNLTAVSSSGSGSLGNLRLEDPGVCSYFGRFLEFLCRSGVLEDNREVHLREVPLVIEEVPGFTAACQRSWTKFQGSRFLGSWVQEY